MITIDTLVHAPIQKAWDYYNTPDHVTQWNFASPDWHCPSAESEFREGGRFSYTMSSKDGKISFDFCGTYQRIQNHSAVSYTLDDGRDVKISFEEVDHSTRIVITFEPETTNPVELQRDGWQAILDNFKQYTENN